MKNKYFFFLIFIAGIIGIYGYRTHTNHIPVQDDLTIMNIKALTENEGPTTEVPDPGKDPIVDPEKGEDKEKRENCILSGGKWNHASVVYACGFERSTCTTDGEVPLYQYTIRGDYKKGEVYLIPWYKCKCEETDGECCTKSGLYAYDQYVGEQNP